MLFRSKTIVMSLVRISPLKYTSYFYYNLFFECNYSGKNTSGQSFKPFMRVAEIKLVNDNGWHIYFNSIRFATGTENDSANLFTHLIPADTNVVSIYDSYDNEEQKRLREQKKKTEQLTEEGKDMYAVGELSDALKKFHEARLVSPDASEPKE